MAKAAKKTTKKKFFEEQKEQSLVKTNIVAKYFDAWSKVMIANSRRYPIERLAYIDLFCGPGRYKDGSKSTPIMVLEMAISFPTVMQPRICGGPRNATTSRGSTLWRRTSSASIPKPALS